MKKLYFLLYISLITLSTFAQTQMNVPVTFDDPTVNYALVGFGGAEQATVIVDPTLASNKVGKVIKTNTAETYAGASITALVGTTQTSFANPIPFTATERRMNVRVWSPHTNISIKLKVEDKNDPTRSCETDVQFTGAASTWQTLEFNFNNQSGGTAAFNPAFTYNKATIFFNFGVSGATAGERTYYFDDVKFGAAVGGGGGGSTIPVLPLDFESVTLDYSFTDFGGGGTTKITNPQSNGINTSANVARMIKSAGEVFGGSFITLAAPIDFSVNKTFKVKVFSPRIGAKLLLKVENAANGSINFEREATSTVANAWEDLTFDYTTISTTNQYSKLIFIFDLGTAGNGTANYTWLFDDVRLITTMPTLSQMNVPVTFDDATVNYALVGFGGAEQATVVVDPTLASNKVGKVIKTNTAETYAGASITALVGTTQTSFANPIPFTATERRMNVRVWSPHTNISIKLKVEDKNDPTRSCETDVVFTGAANTWQTLEFNFNNQSSGTGAFNPAFTFNKATIFFNFGVSGATAGERTYYFDDVKFGPSAVVSTLPVLPLDFESATLNYAFTDFGGGGSTKITNPQSNGINTSANVARMIKSAGEVFGGSFITLASPINFTVNKTFKVKVFSPRVGAKLLLKVENASDGSINFEREATSTVANAWEDLTFDYTTISTTNQYSKLIFIFDLGTAGNGTANYTWLFDDVRLITNTPTLSQMNVPVTFDDATVNYALVGFGGAEQATVVVDPTLASNKVGKVIKTNTAETYAGASITALVGTTQTSFANPIPFTATERRMNVRVWSPHTNISIKLKVEDKNDPTRSCETDAMFTGAANTWQTLEFNFNNQSAGTTAFNPAFTFNKATIFFNFGVSGATAGERTYYFDDVKFGAAVVTPPTLSQMNVPVTFDDATVNYALVGFGGAEQATVVVDPTLASNKVGKVIKTNTAETYAGASISALVGTTQTSFANPIPFTATERRMNVRVWSPHTNISIKLKVEDKNDPTRSCETDAMFTGAANTWQTLEFNFNNQSSGTAAFNSAFTFNKATIFFNFGVSGATAGERTYYFDDVKFGAAVVTPPTLSQMNVPVTFDDATVNYALVGFGGAEQATVVVDPTLASNKVGKVIKTNTAETYAGASITALVGTTQTSFANPIPFTATERRMNVRVWSPHTNISIKLKVEDKNDPTRSCETDAMFTGAANTWQTLEFNFNNQSAGTTAFNPAFTFNKATIFFNFGVSGATAGERTYYFDDVKFGPSAVVSTLPVLPLDFESATLNYAFTDFGGGGSTKIANPQSNGINTSANVARMIKSAGEVFGGSFITLASPINFTVNKTFKVKVFSPRVGAKLLLKVENASDGSINFEREATSTLANAWEDLTFDYTTISTTNQYSKLIFIFDLGTAGNGTANYTWLFDDVRLITSAPTLSQMNVPVTFDDATVNYALVGFGGAEQATVVTDPTLATNKVGKVIKTNTAETYAGASITALVGTTQTSFANAIPFTATERRMNVRVWSPHTNISIKLKVEDKNDPTRSCETDVLFTGAANTWQTLEFNFNNQSAGTAAFNPAFTFNKASIFFNFGVSGAVAGERTYYFDDVKFGAAPVVAPPAPVVISPVNYCQNVTATLSATASTGNSLRWYTMATGGTSSTSAPLLTNSVVGSTTFYVSQINSALVESPRAAITVNVNATPTAPIVSTPISYCVNATASLLSATGAANNTLKWYTIATGGVGSLTPPNVTTIVSGTNTYYVSQTTTSGCESPRAAIIVTVVAPPALPIISATPYTSLYPGLSTTITAAGNVVTGNIYTWFKNGILINGQTNNTTLVNINGVGSYSLTLTNNAGCGITSSSLVITDSVQNKMFVYPNPSNGNFQIRYFSNSNNLKPRKVVVYNSAGALVYSASFVMFSGYTAMNIDLSNKSSGIYMIHLMDVDGKNLTTEKIFVQ